MTKHVHTLLYFLKRNPLTLLSALGLIAAIIFSFSRGRPADNPPNQLTLPASTPFAKNISGSGYVEANTQNIQMGVHIPGVVDTVHVAEGVFVKKGDPLLTLDGRTALAEVMLNEEQVRESSHALSAAKISLEDAIDQYNRGKGLKPGVITDEEMKKREFAKTKAEAMMHLAESQHGQSEHKLNLSRISLDKLTLKAPCDGHILKVRARTGEYLSATSTPIIIGNLTPLHVRVQIDENDIWRFSKTAKAIAYLKSNSDFSYPLTFVRLDPIALSKQNLSGDSRELVDTRIVEVVYRVQETSDTLFIGQQLDVFIEAQQS